MHQRHKTNAHAIAQLHGSNRRLSVFGARDGGLDVYSEAQSARFAQRSVPNLELRVAGEATAEMGKGREGRWLGIHAHRRRRTPAPPQSQESEAVVEVELDRVRAHPQLRDLCHLQRDVTIDDIVGEDASGSEELAVGIEGI